MSRRDKRLYQGIEVRGKDDSAEIMAERDEILGRTIAGLGLRYGPDPDGSKAAFQDPTLPAGFHELADERRWEHSTPASRGKLAQHILTFTGVSPEELEAEWEQALELRNRYRGLAHRRFW